MDYVERFTGRGPVSFEGLLKFTDISPATQRHLQQVSAGGTPAAVAPLAARSRALLGCAHVEGQDRLAECER